MASTVDALNASLHREGMTHIEGVIPARAEEAVRTTPSVLRSIRTSHDGGA